MAHGRIDRRQRREGGLIIGESTRIAIQLAPLPVPAGYGPPADVVIVEAFDASSLEVVDPAAVEAIVTHSVHGVPTELWGRFPNLKLVANFGAGLDRIDLEVAKTRGVAVTYTPDQLTDDVADLALAMILALVRRLPEADAFVRSGPHSGRFPLTTSARGLTLGVLGLGRIGVLSREVVLIDSA
jgi:lactate dehydrogenase-like 2-hydroxyacid dehydrogenase